MSSFYVPTKEVQAIATMLGYRRKKVQIVPAETVTLQGLNWCGGSINRYHAVDLVTYKSTTQNFSAPHPMFNENEGARVKLPVNGAIVRTGVFMGKDSIMTIYVRPDNMPAALTSYAG
jgi:electron transfer flavoprotein alpha subunit